MLAAMWQFIKRYPMTYLIILFSIIANYIFWAIPTRVTQAIIDAMADHSLTGQSLALFIGIILVVSVAQYTSEYLWMSRLFSQSAFYIKEVKLNLYQKIISMRIQFFEKFRSGDMMTRFTSDVRGIEDFMGYGIMGFLLSAGNYFIIIPIMLSISWKVTLLALIPSSLILLPLVILTRRQEEAVTQQRDAVAALSNEVLEVIEGIRVTRAYGNKQEASQRFQTKTRDLASKAIRIMYYQAAFGRLSITIMSLTAAIVIGVGGLEMAAGHLTLGQIIALQLYSLSLAEPLWSYFVESWKQVGINVELLDGRLYDFNSYADMLRSDDQSFDVFEGAWGTGGDPNPTGFYSKKAPFNYERWADDKNEELLDALSSDKAFDEAYRKEAFHAWQAYTNEELPAIPYLYRYGIRSVNNRVKHYDVANGSSFGIEQLELTADEPIK